MHQNFIAGAWREGGAAGDNINPSDTNDVVGTYAQGSAADVDDAVAAARKAFPAWSRSAIQSRHDALQKVSLEILARKDELGRLLAREEGKTLPEAIGEVTRAAQVFGFFAGETLRLAGEKLPSTRPGIEVEISREPVGVVAMITPWNFPIAIPAWKIAPALCYGNTVVFKPADLAPGSAWALAEIISRAGLPEGVFNLVMGRGSVVGDALIGHRDIDAVTFTGSQQTGRLIAGRSAERMRRIQLEMGGKNPLVVLDDADLDIAVGAALNGAFFSTGQRCTASSRLIVTKGIHDRFVELLVARLDALVVGNALHDGVHIGPVVDQRQLDQDIDYIELARSEGAELAYGGERLKRDTPGFFLQPALFTGTSPDMRINREEVFGPVASVIAVSGYDEALAVANDTEFGLSAGICTTSLKNAADFRSNSRAGMVMVNLPTAGVDFHVPFGGTRNSSHGPREQGRYAAEFYTTVKTAYIQP